MAELNPPPYRRTPPPYDPPPSYDDVYSISYSGAIGAGGELFQLGAKPETVFCQRCDKCVLTLTHMEPSPRTHLVALFFCVLCFPLAVLPYCVGSYATVRHSCPVCYSLIGYYD